MALAQPREDREEDDPMKHRPTALAELRSKSFAATGALVSVTNGLQCPSTLRLQQFAQWFPFGSSQSDDYKPHLLSSP